MRRPAPQRHLNASTTNFAPPVTVVLAPTLRFARLEPHRKQKPDDVGVAGTNGLEVRPLNGISCIATLRMSVTCLSPGRTNGRGRWYSTRSAGPT
jgi:hypothetical protein